MLFGCCTQVESYGLLEEAGYDYIELSGRVISAMPQEAFRAVRQRIREGGLDCRGLVAYCPPEVIIAGPGFDADGAAEYAKRCAERAAQLGARTVGVGSPKSRTLPDGFERETARRQAETFFAVTCEAFRAYGINVCVEPLGYCFCNFINTLEEALAIVRSVNTPNLKLIVDYFNMEQSGEQDAAISPYLPDVAAVHMSDDVGSPWERSFFRPDRAFIHSGRVQSLINMGYDETVSLEIDVPVTLSAAKQSLEILKAH